MRLFAWAVLSMSTLVVAGAHADEQGETITVKLDSNREGTVLERRANRVRGWQLTLPVPSYVVTEQWEPVCYAPCTVKLDANSMYSIGGGSAATSSTFGLPRGKDPLVLHVRAGSANTYTFGVVTTFFGIASILVGGAVALSTVTDTEVSGTQNFRYSGLGLLGAGVVSTVVGVILWVANRTKVVTEDGRRL
jgi:hypothetical protein